MVITATCQACGEDFDARRVSAKWCSDRCRKAKSRAAVEPEFLTPSEVPSGLVSSVRADLEKAHAESSFAGQLALELARRLSHPDETGISSLSKELRTVMAAAMEGVTPPASQEDVDEVAKARESRERKARQAAGGA